MIYKHIMSTIKIYGRLALLEKQSMSHFSNFFCFIGLKYVICNGLMQ